MTNYTVGDFLIQIKNAVMAGHKNVSVKHTKLSEGVAQALLRERYLSKVEVKDGKLTVDIAYHKKQAILMNIKLISRPGLRIYADVKKLAARRSSTTLILTTPDGVLSLSEALKKNIGGEIIAEIL